MEINLYAKYRLILVKLYGEIDHHSAEAARRAVEREIKRTGAVNVAFDFGQVTFMDSSGIGMIIGRYKTVSALCGSVIIYGASEPVIRLLKMAGIDRLVIISRTLQEGIRMMKKELIK